MANILVVDDEMGIRELLSEILSDEGHVVQTAENAQQAREARAAETPDLVLLDIWMPDTDGVTLLKEWQRVPEGFVVPSVFFPQPELTPLGDTFASYAVEYDWYIRFFASTDEDAYASAAAALNALCAARLLVPLIDETGAAAGGGVRLKDPGGVKRLDTGTAQLTLHWDSRRPYNRVDCQKVMHYNLDLKAAEGKTE